MDPDGVDRSAFRDWCRGAVGRDVRFMGDGPFLLAYMPSALDRVHAGQFNDSMVVADARIDQHPWSDEQIATAAVFDRLVRSRGGAGLAAMVADFAVARIDTERGELLLSRDAFGLRPLVWTKRGRRVAFASDASTLIRLREATGSWTARSFPHTSAPATSRTVELRSSGSIGSKGGGGSRSTSKAGRAGGGGSSRIGQAVGGFGMRTVEATGAAIVDAAADRAGKRAPAVLLSGGEGFRCCRRCPCAGQRSVQLCHASLRARSRTR